MNLSVKEYNNLLNISREVADKCYGADNMKRIPYLMYHTQDYFGNINFVTESGEIIDRSANPDAIYVIIDPFDLDNMTAVNLNSEILRNAGNYFIQFADAVEKVEKGEINISSNTSIPSFLNIKTDMN